MPTHAQLESARDAWLAAPHGERTAIVERWARQLGISAATLRRHLNALGHRGTAHPRAAEHPEYRAWAQTLADLMARAPAGTIPLHLCLRAALTPDPATGETLLPPEATTVPLATFQRIIRDELGMRQTDRRNRRMHADHANQAWQLDATTSKYLIVEEELEDGDYTLRLHRNPMPSSGYKNKPLKEHRLRLLYYGIWDMYTGGQVSVPVIARGESGLDAIEALCTIMQGTGDARIPLHGVVTDLWSDQGVLVKHAATRDLLERLEINVVTGEPYAKQRMGGVEQTWRRLWETFEASLFLCAPTTGKAFFKLSQIRARLTEYLAETWQRPSRRDAALTRADAWTRSINQAGGARRCPDHPLETIAKERRCWVDGAGVIRWNNIEYEVPVIHRQWVIARRALDGSDRVVVEDEATGQRWDVSPYQPYAYGEHLRSPVLPIEEARTRARASTHVPGDIYAPGNAQTAAVVAAPNVVAGRFGPRQQPARDLPDPLAADRYASLSDAMADFFGIFGAPLSADNRAAVEGRLLRDGLTKAAVRELALTLSSATRTTGAIA